MADFRNIYFRVRLKKSKSVKETDIRKIKLARRNFINFEDVFLSANDEFRRFQL
jgi:hypothetical protein